MRETQLEDKFVILSGGRSQQSKDLHFALRRVAGASSSVSSRKAVPTGAPHLDFEMWDSTTLRVPPFKPSVGLSGD
jgi:hypothetical protein